LGPTITSRPYPANSGQKAKELMKLNLALNTWAKTMFLGAAVLLASTAFASNKGSLMVRENVEVNGQQLSAGEYQLRWTGSGSDVELSFMKGKKEVLKTTARVVSLNEAPNFDSAVVDHSNGKAAVSQVRFAGKKFALTIGATDKAEMAGGK
jgi:hypothetical protein